jgi:FdhD protein
MKASAPDVTRVPVVRFVGSEASHALDALAVEEPLELRLAWSSGGASHEQPVSITMRTPGHDFELAVGFLLGEGVLRQARDVIQTRHVGPPLRPDGTSNAVVVELGVDPSREIQMLARHFFATSSCGVCGKATIDSLRTRAAPLRDTALPRLAHEVLYALPTSLREGQSAFERTGGIHAAALFDAEGRLLVLREDVGRHNAVDKVVGAMSDKAQLPASQAILLLSGRASFELVQKALMAGIPMLAAVGAPSSLAVDLAREVGMTLVGFLRDGRFNIYAGHHRLTSR